MMVLAKVRFAAQGEFKCLAWGADSDLGLLWARPGID
jgi:hypothetical protein